MGTKTRRKTVKRHEKETYDLRDRIIANGGTVQADTLDAVTVFIGTLKNAAVWNSLADVGIFVGDQLAAALVKLKYPNGGQSLLTNVGFVGGNYTERGGTGGLTGSGVGKYLRTGVTPNQIGNLQALSVYAVPDVEGTNPNTKGGLIGSESWWLVHHDEVGTPAAWSGLLGKIETVGYAPGGAFAGGPGFLTASSPAVNEVRAYFNGNGSPLPGISDDVSPDPVTQSNSEYYVFAINNSVQIDPGAGARAPFAGRVLFYAISTGLSKANALALFSAAQKLQLSLNRAAI